MSAAQYEVISLSISDLDRIKLPQFQRKLVWNKQKKDQFIETLHEGLPFGAILVYPMNNEPDSTLLILDGQQRLSTIREFQEHPLLFWKPLNESAYKECLDSVNQHLSEDTQLSPKDFDEILGYDINKYYDWLYATASQEDDREAIKSLILNLRTKLDSYIDPDSLKIPAIRYFGSKDRIAAVFSNLNRGGIPLSKYEIYSAAWIHTEIPLLPHGESDLQDEILQNVKDYYAEMENSTEFELEGFSEDELTKNRVINLSEYGTALGMFIQKHLSSLVPKTASSASEIGFGVLGIAAGIDNKRLGELNSSLDDINRNLQSDLEYIARICTNLHGVFSKILKVFKAKKNDEYAQGISTTFKTLSYFAALWNLDPSSIEYQNSLINIKSSYVYDALTKAWSSHGDQRLYEYYPKIKRRDYLTPVPRDKFIDAFRQWLSDDTPNIRFSGEIKALVTIHANLTYLAAAVPYAMDFELEHIISKKLINASDNPGRRAVHGGSIGNCMYLPKLQNNKKKEKNLYQVNDYGEFDELIVDSLYPTRDDLAAATAALSQKNFITVNDIILKRSLLIGDSLIDALLKN